MEEVIRLAIAVLSTGFLTTFLKNRSDATLKKDVAVFKEYTGIVDLLKIQIREDKLEYKKDIEELIKKHAYDIEKLSLQQDDERQQCQKALAKMQNEVEKLQKQNSEQAHQLDQQDRIIANQTFRIKELEGKVQC